MTKLAALTKCSLALGTLLILSHVTPFNPYCEPLGGLWFFITILQMRTWGDKARVVQLGSEARQSSPMPVLWTTVPPCMGQSHHSFKHLGFYHVVRTLGGQYAITALERLTLGVLLRKAHNYRQIIYEITEGWTESVGAQRQSQVQVPRRVAMAGVEAE